MTTTPDAPLEDDDLTTSPSAGAGATGADADGLDGGDADSADRSLVAHAVERPVGLADDALHVLVELVDRKSVV